MSQQVFISYSRHDGHPHAEKLESELKAAGYRVWRDTRNINPNQDFTAEIEVGIEKSDLVAVCVTPDIRRDNSFVRREVQYALIDEKPIFPCFMVEKVKPPISIINKEWLEFHKDWHGAFARLLTLVGDPRLQQSTGDYQAPPDEPFREYLQKLYGQIVRYLDQAVIKLIDLEAEASPEAVPEKQAEDILLEFFESSIFADDTTDDLPKHTTFKDAFEHHKGRLLLLGEPGAGKTITLMSHARDAVAARLTDPSLPLPVLKILATWKSNPPAPLVEWSAGKMEELKPVIASGRALLLLDGLDELGERNEIRTEVKDPETGEPIVDEETGEHKVDITYYDPRQRLIDAVDDLHANNQVLVTCRVADYAAIGQQIPLDGAITLQPLTDEQLREYLADHEEIYAAIQADEQLRELARTPLLLSLITFAWDKLDAALKEKRDLQAGDVRDAIFEAYCRQRYAHEATKRHADLPFTDAEMMEVLGELAMWNAQNRRPGKDFGDDDRKPEENVLIPYDFEYVIKDEKRIEAFQQMTSQLNILAPTNEADYRFVHLLLRDFLAFTFALPRMQDQSFWREGKYTASHPFSALGTIKDSRAVDPLIDCLGDANASLRERAARALGEIGDGRAVEPLIECLRDVDAAVRETAADALGDIGWQPQTEEQQIQYLIASQSWGAVAEKGREAVKPLIECLRDVDAAVRETAAGVLKHIGWQPQTEEQQIQYLIACQSWEEVAKKGHAAVEPLMACLGDANVRVGLLAADALGEIGDGRAVEPLIACLVDADMRERAARALGEIGDGRAVEPLIECLGDADWQVRRAAAKALGGIGDGQAVQPLIGCLGDANWRVRRSAARALAQIGERAVEPLIECLRDANAVVRETAASALGRIGDGRTVQPLIECLRDGDGHVRRDAAVALGRIGDGRAVEPLIECLRDANAAVRRDAAVALGGIGDMRAVEPLVTCLGDADERVRRAVAEALGQIGDGRAVEPLIECLRDADRHMRERAADALAKIGQPAVEPLLSCLGDADADVRGVAAEVLVKIEESAVEPLLSCLGDADADVRGTAAWALGSIGDARAVEPLLSCLRDADADVREAAVVALWEIRDARAVAPLIECLRDENERVRIFAAGALRVTGDERAVEPLIECLDDADLGVRHYAAEALGRIGDGRAVGPLIPLLEDRAEYSLFSNERVCDAAYDALQAIGTPEALQACTDWIAAGNKRTPKRKRRR